MSSTGTGAWRRVDAVGSLLRRAGPGRPVRGLLLALAEHLQVIGPLSQRVALLLNIVVSVVRRDDAGLSMIQAPLGDVRTDAELGKPGAFRSPKVVQREFAYLVLGKGIEMPCDAARQEPRIHGPVTGFRGEDPRASAGQSLQAPELF